MTEFTHMTASELGAAIASRAISPVEATNAFLARIAAVNSSLNAFVTVDEAGAKAAAKIAEREILQGRARGPLHGVPIAHKDLYNTKGLRTTAGSKVLEHNVPGADATVVARLAAAGTILLGKTNTHEFAYGPTSEVSMFGPVCNPWDRARISGGSSGGSGAAVAAGLVPLASGSDTGGSIRIPAALCGLTGLKPTYSRISRGGIIPLSWSLDHAGPLARSAKDAALFLQATAGYDPNDPASSREGVADYASAMTGDVRGLRIGVARRYFFERSQESVAALADGALGVLKGLGAELIDVNVPYCDEASVAVLTICVAEAAAYHDDTLASSPGLYSNQVRTFLDLGNQLLAKDYLHAQRLRVLFGRGLDDLFKTVDVIATPANAITAPMLGAPNVVIRGAEEGGFGALLRNTEPFNLSGHPAIVTPCGFDAAGLPAGLQLVAPAFQEALILKVADAYQRVTDWHLRWPGL